MSELIKFPCDFSIKIMGENTDSFIQDITEIVLKHFPDFDLANLQHKPSKNNNYVGITATVHATSQDILDALYREIHQHPKVKMLL